MREAAVVDIPGIDGGNEIWVEALPARIYHTPQYGPVPVTKDKLARMITNFNDGVRGQEIATDFDHGMDRSKGNQASGWYRELTLKPSTDDPTQLSLFARIELTDDARKELGEKKWKYFSLEWDDEWLDNNGALHADVITGGGFTNRPIAKNMMPINFSEALWEELDYETKKQFAVWSTKFMNDLPDSAFLYIQPGGSKDSEGKTTPRSLRHFPYKGPDGKIDLPHLRNAIARIPQAGEWLSDSLEKSLQSRARKLLGAAGKAMSEGTELADAFDLLTTQGFDITTTDESKEWEHSEPGTGSPPQPRTDEDGSDDIAIEEGWRREDLPDPLPPQDSMTTDVPLNITGTVTTTDIASNAIINITRGGKKVPEITTEQDFELRRIFDIDANGDLVEAAKLQLGELTELRRTVDAATQEKKFAEEYPAFWGEHNALMHRDRENTAKAFSESVAKVRKAEGYGLKETSKGLSGMALSKVKDLHMKFSEGTATLDEFEDCIRTIVQGGIVEFGEIGSASSEDIPIVNTDTAGGIQTAKKIFAEVVNKIQAENPDWDYRKCITEATSKHPDLAEANQVALPI